MNKRIIKNRLRRLRNAAEGFLKKTEKKVVFESFTGRQYSDNPRAISEKMHELYPDYRLIWGMDGPVPKDIYHIRPDYIEIMSMASKEYRKELDTATAFVRNEVMSEDLYKKKDQLFIQTWHGDRGIKKILYDSLESRNVSSRAFGYSDQYITDLFITGSDYACERIKTAFRYNGKTLKTGCPRNDHLLFPAGTAQVKERLGIDPGRKILLYAPTVRRNKKVLQTVTVDIHRTLEAFSKKGGDWICLVRAHPKALGLDIQNDPGIINVSDYPDMADLLMIADALITDYSSCAGDFILRKKPVILAQLDLDQYLEENRTFHVDPQKAGFLIVKSQEELENLIKTTDEEEYAKNCEQVMAFFGTCESGHSAEDVCRIIDEHYHKTHRD